LETKIYKQFAHVTEASVYIGEKSEKKYMFRNFDKDLKKIAKFVNTILFSTKYFI
jgi:hypothetical protein